MPDDFRALHVWTRSLVLVDEAYRVVNALPATERFGLSGQMRRAAVSVVSNIAEGNGRIHRKEYIHHLSIARGSTSELRAQAIVAEHLRLVPAATTASLQRSCDEVSRMLFVLIQRLAE